MRLAVILLAIATTACNASSDTTGERRRRFNLAFLAANDRGEPVGGVAVTLDGVDAGATDAAGSLWVSARALEGSTTAVTARCPAGYERADVVSTIVLREYAPIGREGEQMPLEIAIGCPRARRVAALIVSTNGRSGIPVIVDGTERAVTDESGVAHVAVSLSPRASVRVALDTSENRSLRPQNPTAVFTMGNRDELFVFDQSFERKRRKRQRRRKATIATPEPESPKPRRPVRMR